MHHIIIKKCGKKFYTINNYESSMKQSGTKKWIETYKNLCISLDSAAQALACSHHKQEDVS